MLTATCINLKASVFKIIFSDKFKIMIFFTPQVKPVERKKNAQIENCVK